MKSAMRHAVTTISVMLSCLIFLFDTVSCTNDHLTDLAKKSNVMADTTKTQNNVSTTTTASASSSPSTPTSVTTPAAGTVSFKTDIAPILSKYQCASCHGSFYSSYSGASSLAKSGQLYGTMSWSQGYRRMPPGSKATAAELTLISNWIKQGTPNN